MIKVLQLCDSIQYQDGRMTVIMNLYKKIDKSKYQFDFFCLDTDAQYTYQNEIESYGGHIFCIPRNSTLFQIREKFIDIVKRNNYKFIQYHAVSKLGCVLDLAHRYKIKVIVESHSTRLTLKRGFLKKSLNRIFSLNVLFSSDYRVAISPEAGKELFLFKHFIWIPNMIDYTKYSYNPKKRKIIRNRFKISSTSILVGVVGRLDQWKNQMFALNILKELVKVNSEFKLILIGSDTSSSQDYLHKLQKYILDYNLEDYVVMTGNISNVEDYYSALDILWIPSIFEGLPTVAIEGQSNGLPLVINSTITKVLKINENVYFKTVSNKEDWIKLTNQSNRLGSKQVLENIKNSTFDTSRIIKKWQNIYDN